MCTRHHFIPYPKHTAHPKIIHGPTFQLQPVSYKRYFRCNNCFLLLVYTIHLSLSTKVDPPPMPYHLFKTHINILELTTPPQSTHTIFIDWDEAAKRSAVFRQKYFCPFFQSIIQKSYVTANFFPGFIPYLSHPLDVPNRLLGDLNINIRNF